MRGAIWVVLSGVALLVLANLGGGYLIGAGLDERLGQALEKADAETEELVIELVEHKRGTLSSSATIRIELAADIAADYRQQIGRPIAFQIPAQIEHGPLLWGGDGPRLGMAQLHGELRLSSDTIAGIKQASGNQLQWQVPLDGSPADLNAFLAFDGGVDAGIDLHDFAGALLSGAHDELRLQLQGVEGSYASSQGGEVVESSLSGELFGYRLSPDSGKIKDFTFSARVWLHESGLWPGEWRAQIGSLEMLAEQSVGLNRGEDSELGVDDISVHYALQIKGEGEDATGELGVEARIGESRLIQGGDRIHLRRGVVSGSLTRLPVERLLSLQELTQQVEGLGMSDSQLNSELRALLTGFLNAGPRLQVDDFSLYGEQGRVGLSGFVELAGEQAQELNLLSLLAGGLTTEFEVTAHKQQLLAAIEQLEGGEAADRFGQWLNDSIAIGYADEGDGVVSTKVVWKGGQASINGESADYLFDALLNER